MTLTIHLPYSKKDHRADIDGLRAIAVLAIVLFHAFPEQLTGGYIGVDIFLVISGFLITQIWLEPQPLFTVRRFKDFYVRRIKRIFPALLLTGFASAAVAWSVLFPRELELFGKHLAAGSLFIPNLIFWHEAGYFDAISESKPLLHLWSLGVEVQFYLLWPILMALWLRSKFNKWVGFACVWAGSWGMNIYLSLDEPAAAFFSPLPRLWEFMAGGLMAAAVSHNRFVPRQPMTADLVSVLGMVLIIMPAVFFFNGMHALGVWNTVPVVGASCIILAGNQAWINKHVLSATPMVWIGAISFPLYLWHWPLLSFVQILNGSEVPEPIVRMYVLAIACVLAYTTCVLVEQPIRFNTKLKSAGILMAAMLVMGMTGLYMDKSKGLPDRPQIRSLNQQSAALQFGLEDTPMWYCAEPNDEGPRCFTTGPYPTVVVMGDSHAYTLYSGLRKHFDGLGKQLALYGGSDGCPPLLDVVIQDQGGETRHCLQRGTAAMRRVIADPAIEEVILTSRGPLYTSGEGFGNISGDHFGKWMLFERGQEPGKEPNTTVFVKGLSRTLDALLLSGKKVTFVHDVPELGFDISSCLPYRPWRLTENTRQPCAVSRAVFEQRTAAHQALVEQVLSARPSVKQVDLAQALCDAQYCYGMKDNKPLYIDDDHLSHIGSEYVVHSLRDKF
jgi:peptidoglycan/LPS O-acetylase OafA/YrhL